MFRVYEVDSETCRFLIFAVGEVIVLNVALGEEDIQFAAEQGLERALGITAVSLAGRLATAWGDVKTR